MSDRIQVIKAAAENGVLVVSPDASRGINVAQPGDTIDFNGGARLPEAKIGAALGRVASGIKDLFTPMTDDQKRSAGIAPRR